MERGIVWKVYVPCRSDIYRSLKYTLNIKLILNQKFDKKCQEIYSPRNAFCISRDEGLMEPNISIFKDTLINFSAFLSMNKSSYTPEQLKQIKALQKKYKDAI